MATGRIDAGGRDALSVARPAPAVVTDRATTTTVPAAVEAATALDFQDLLEPWARRPQGERARSPRQLVAAFVEPAIADMTPFLGGGALAILERIAADILPTLGDNEELRSLSRAIINEEIARHRELARRRLSEIPL